LIIFLFSFYFSFRADIDFNGFLTEDEISKWIQAKIEQHINQAIAENYITFAHIDVNPKDGMLRFPPKISLTMLCFLKPPFNI